MIVVFKATSASWSMVELKIAVDEVSVVNKRDRANKREQEFSIHVMLAISPFISGSYMSLSILELRSLQA